MRFANKNVIVTGASSGIGKEVATRIAREGGQVIIFDINEVGAAELMKEIPEKIDFVKVDLGNSAGLIKAIENVNEKYQKIDVLINVAGIIAQGAFENTTLDEWNRVMSINLTAVYVLCNKCFRIMKENKYGRIVNVSSIAAKRGGGGLGNSIYATSKAGVIGLTKAIAREGGPYGIACNAVCPGYTLTPMTKELPDEFQTQAISSIALRRAAKPEETAAVICFLASDDASYVTGEITDADGGVMLDG